MQQTGMAGRRAVSFSRAGDKREYAVPCAHRIARCTRAQGAEDLGAADV